MMLVIFSGNINAQDERVYYRPGVSGYRQTQIDPTAGERWFCSEDEAVQAGWRPKR